MALARINGDLGIALVWTVIKAELDLELFSWNVRRVDEEAFVLF